ncbi:MAG: hypothetical protein ACYCYN_08395, partial [Solirubrobacteraceae bacterium]
GAALASLLPGAALASLLPGAASAAPTTAATLSASFQPDRLGGRTTLQFGFALSTPEAGIPPPLRQIELRYPADIGIYNSELGLATCQPSVLEASGPRACPADSVMGYGLVHTGVMLGATHVFESSTITVFRAPYEGRHFALLFFAEGREPVLTSVIFPGLLLSASEPFGGRVSIGVPLVQTLPGAPFVSVLRMHATIGPEKVTYFKRAGGITFAFRPRGIRLPRSCPRHRFPFSAQFTFADGTRAQAHTTIGCPPAQARSGTG